MTSCIILSVKRSTRKKINSSGMWPCDMCNARHFLSEHHIRGRDIPDYNHPSNIGHICDNCHRSVHEGAFVVEGWFMTEVGLKLVWHRSGEEGVSGDDAVPYQIRSKGSSPPSRKEQS